MKKLYLKYKEQIIQLIKFSIVGVANTAISTGVSWGMMYFFKVDLLFAQTVAFLVSVLNAYYWNKNHVFAKKEKQKQAPQKWHVRLYRNPIFRTYAVYTTTFTLFGLLLCKWFESLTGSGYLATAMIIPLNVPTNFLLIKFWALK